MNFDSYTDCGVVLAVDLVNSEGISEPDELGDLEALRTFLEDHEISAPGPLSAVVLGEVMALRPRLRAVFEAADGAAAARMINDLLQETAALPQLTDHDGDAWHLHFTPPGAPLAARLAAEAAMGLAGVMRAGGHERLGICADIACLEVFVDASRNRSRRFCNPDLCGNRSSVAAHRARRRAMAGP
ncbi:MAG: hypothetical protein GEU81_06405 [Nitriliruptorales bacterium]|nr:hypothetical protein [Nitriliruptorales bacterium]